MCLHVCCWNFDVAVFVELGLEAGWTDLEAGWITLRSRVRRCYHAKNQWLVEEYETSPSMQ